MDYRIKLIVLAASAAIIIVGCQPSEGPIIEDKVPPGERNISINELAATLGMRISESNHTHVVLKNSANTVMIFTLNGGKFYVNTKPIGEVGSIERKAGQIYVPSSLIERIRSAMRAYAPLPPTPVPSPTPRTRRLSGTVVIDPGHGGKDPGARSVLGFYEKGINLSVALDVARLLEQRGLRVKMTRTDDYFVELEDRAAVANNIRADLFVSIHADSFPKNTRRGYTVYIAKSASSSSRRAANAIARSMSGTGLNSFGVQTANYHVLTDTRGPAVLVEMGYLSNRSEAALLRSSSFQDRLARAVADGISDYFE
jgi:N-acetylmuramoyl-L-alanine amidase